jgi:hypothetical protein
MLGDLLAVIYSKISAHPQAECAHIYILDGCAVVQNHPLLGTIPVMVYSSGY